jgi:hypothetical protein
MGKMQLVMAFFESEAAADDAVAAVKDWDRATKEIKLGGIGVLVKDEEGKVKKHKLGKRKTGTGVLIGALVGVLTGGVSIVGGALAGGVLGAFFHQGLGLSKDDLDRIGGELDGGKAAVTILAEPDEAEAVADKLAELGGVPETHEVSEEAVAQAEEAAEEETEEEPEGEPEE